MKDSLLGLTTRGQQPGRPVTRHRLDPAFRKKGVKGLPSDVDPTHWYDYPRRMRYLVYINTDAMSVCSTRVLSDLLLSPPHLCPTRGGSGGFSRADPQPSFTSSPDPTSWSKTPSGCRPKLGPSVSVLRVVWW